MSNNEDKIYDIMFLVIFFFNKNKHNFITILGRKLILPLQAFHHLHGDL